MNFRANKMTPLYFFFVTLFQTSHKLNEKLLDLVKKDLTNFDFVL